MTEAPMTPEVRAEIARLCGAMSKAGSGPVEWWFPMRDGATCDRFDGSINIPAHRWLSLKGEPGDDMWIAVQESILLRGLARAGVLGSCGSFANSESFFANPGYAFAGSTPDRSGKGPTPLAALVALAAAHIESNKTNQTKEGN